MVCEVASRLSIRMTVAGTSGSGNAPAPPDMSVHVGETAVALVVRKMWCPPFGPWWPAIHTVCPVASAGSNAAPEIGCQSTATAALELQVTLGWPVVALAVTKSRAAEKAT